jgi:hypothetical protein
VSHVRQQLRERVASVLTTAAVAGVIAQSRVHPLPAGTSTAALIYTVSETVTETTLTRPRKLSRELVLAIELVARATADLDDTLDGLCVKAEEAIGADPTLNALAKDCVLRTTTITQRFEGDAPIGSARLEFVVLYRTSETDSDLSV